jgi:hypothetical protein
MAESALLVGKVCVVGRRWQHLALRVVTQQAVVPTFELVRDLWGLGDKGLCRFGPALRRVAAVASWTEVGFAGRFVALGALEGQWLVVGVAV